MTGPDAAEHPGDPSRPLKRSRYSANDQEELDLLDTIVKRIKTAVPPTPYILSTPSLDPYRYHSQQQANAWMIGRLWRPDEEHLQYRTYLYREPCQDCFELQAGQDEEPEPEPPRSQTVNGQPTKKKPNLSAFKVKQVNGAAAPGAKTSSSSRPPTKNTSDQVNGITKSEKLSAPAQKAEPRSPRSSSNTMRDDRKATREAPQVSSRPRAPSTSQKSDTAGYKSHVEKSDPSNSTPHGLPPLLSPVREPLGNPYGLPTILSPTLPSNVQAELDRLEVQRKRADSDASISSSDIKSVPITVPADSSQKSSASLKTENRGRSVSVNGKSPNPEPVSPSQQTHANMIVKLKFSKPKAQVVSQILRLPPKRSSAEKKERTDTPKATATDSQPKVTDPPVIKKKPAPKITARRAEPTTPASTSTPTTSAKPTPASAKVVEKRLRTEEDGSLAVPPAKRPRASSTNEPPVASAPTTASPAASAKPSAQKSNSLHPTPKKDTRSINMLRTQSSESNEATPGRSGATPAGSKAELKAGPTSAPLNNKKQIDISLLGQTSARLNQTGRALKHEATKILNAASSKKDEKRAAVTNLECILAYMAAYSAQDLSLNLRGRAGEVEQTWKTLLPLCLSYSRCTRDFQHLDGLRSYLSSVIASAICTHVSQRFSSSKSHDSPQDINHPESARQHIENFALLSDHTLKMNRHYQEARIALPFEDLQNIYKKTYAGREVNAKLAREPEKVSGAKMSGPYFLPLGIDTTPIQAVRFGLKFLHEFCEKEKLEYSLRVNLDRPE